MLLVVWSMAHGKYESSGTGGNRAAAPSKKLENNVSLVVSRILVFPRSPSVLLRAPPPFTSSPLAKSLLIVLGHPPIIMSVPLPAMFVETVTMFNLPACAERSEARRIFNGSRGRRAAKKLRIMFLVVAHILVFIKARSLRSLTCAMSSDSRCAFLGSALRRKVFMLFFFNTSTMRRLWLMETVPTRTGRGVTLRISSIKASSADLRVLKITSG